MNKTDELRLHRLVSGVCGGQITDDEIRELDHLLTTDPHARQMYVAYLDIHAALAERGYEKRKVECEAGDKLRRTELVTMVSRRPLACGIRERMMWGGALVATVLIAIAALLNTSSDKQLAGRDNWLGGPGTTFGTVSLNSGAMRMNLQGVGTLVVDGPAQMELVSPMHLRVDQGRVKLRVTEETGHGFVVSTPHGDVTDLGTEFAVDVGDLNSTNLVVFDGKVDLSIPRGPGEPIIQRLVGGEGVRFARTGQLDRIMAIFTGSVETFLPSDQLGLGGLPVIINVSDNLPSGDTNRFYEIVPGGFDEDKVAYVDRLYEWNGVTKEGLPHYLVGGDYIRTFNDNKNLDFQLTVEVSRPCDLYVLWDQRVPVAPWLEESFAKMDGLVGLDEFAYPGRPNREDKDRGIGPGNSIGQHFLVWHRTVAGPGKIQLGALGAEKTQSSMYGVVVVASGDAVPEASRDKPDTSALVVFQ